MTKKYFVLKIWAYENYLGLYIINLKKFIMKLIQTATDVHEFVLGNSNGFGYKGFIRNTLPQLAIIKKDKKDCFFWFWKPVSDRLVCYFPKENLIGEGPIPIFRPANIGDKNNFAKVEIEYGETVLTREEESSAGWGERK